jgi:hypothetical protein
MSACSHKEKSAVGSYQFAVKSKNTAYGVQLAVFDCFCF